ncbi:basic salivary proline-rich protein 4-like, partial [Plectropomus leopardus]|uniref:basic salivary proline-rich protein 4-like n=1 Tax=Plectropomus leopardus TaxID=160734 RepID=UPI001C4AECA4
WAATNTTCPRDSHTPHPRGNKQGSTEATPPRPGEAHRGTRDRRPPGPAQGHRPRQDLSPQPQGPTNPRPAPTPGGEPVAHQRGQSPPNPLPQRGGPRPTMTTQPTAPGPTHIPRGEDGGGATAAPHPHTSQGRNPRETGESRTPAQPEAKPSTGADRVQTIPELPKPPTGQPPHSSRVQATTQPSPAQRGRPPTQSHRRHPHSRTDATPPDDRPPVQPCRARDGGSGKPPPRPCRPPVQHGCRVYAC